MKFGFVDEHRAVWPVQSDVRRIGPVGQRLLRLARTA